MMWLAVLTMLLFEGLAICTIGGMVTYGFSTGAALTAAVSELVLGILVVRMMYRDAQRA